MRKVSPIVLGKEKYFRLLNHFAEVLNQLLSISGQLAIGLRKTLPVDCGVQSNIDLLVGRYFALRKCCDRELVK